MVLSKTAGLIRVLVVEDREDDYIYLKHLLRKAVFSNYELEWVMNYEQGLAALEQRRHDVGLFDYQLGGATGLDLLREALARKYEIPIILLTGNESPEVDRDAANAGASDYLCKDGLSTTQLERSIRYTIKHAKILSELKKSQEQINRYGQLLKGITNGLPIMAGRLDAQGLVVEAEGDGLASCGIKPNGLVGRILADAYPQGRVAIEQALAGQSIRFALFGTRNDREWHAEFMVFFDADSGSGAIFLGHDVSEQKTLEREILKISDVEQHRIGADLHDGLGQHLTGISCLATALRDRIRVKNPEETKQAELIAKLANDATAQARALARGLLPVQLEKFGLLSALEDLTYQIQILHGIQCQFINHQPEVTFTHEVAVHLYRIAQEAITNAIRHGEANSIKVIFSVEDSLCRLVIEDNGLGFGEKSDKKSLGMGLRLMKYRASVIGATVTVKSKVDGGAIMECALAYSNNSQ
ncbi:MAG TPA: response regulator [Opitutaceae bacterium]|nr:response regulator [Opitutaceae bacterium]